MEDQLGLVLQPERAEQVGPMRLGGAAADADRRAAVKLRDARLAS